MPQVPTPLPPDRIQPPSVTASQRSEGGRTLLSDRQGRFLHVKAVGWVRRREGDSNHWSLDPSLTPPPVPELRPHPALLQARERQRVEEERREGQRRSQAESATSNAVYGLHALPVSPHTSGSGAGSSSSPAGSARATSARVTSGPDANAAVNAVGATQIAEQQGKLWGSLDATSKRLGFGISAAPAGSPLRELEREAARKRFTSVYAGSYADTAGKGAEIVVGEPMNRTSPLFPLQPVNLYSAARRLPNTSARFSPASTKAPTQQLQREEAKEAHAPASAMSSTGGLSGASLGGSQQLTHGSSGHASPASPTSTQHSPLRLPAGADAQTAAALGYGRRHQFYRHYLTSLPDV